MSIARTFEYIRPALCVLLAFLMLLTACPLCHAESDEGSNAIELVSLGYDGAGNGEHHFSAMLKNIGDEALRNIEAAFLLLDEEGNIIDSCYPVQPARVRPGQSIRVSGTVRSDIGASYFTIDGCSFIKENGERETFYFPQLPEPVAFEGNDSVPVSSQPEAGLGTVGFVNDPIAIADAASSVVRLDCYDKNGELYSTGSGFVMFGDGVIVTNYHVIAGKVHSITARREDGLSFEISSVLAFDEARDIAILKTDADANMQPLLHGSSADMMKGEKVLAIGSPLGLLNSVSEGVFSGYVSEEGQSYVQFSAAISHGSSGGPLFDDRGLVIGICSASYEEAQNINLAVPVESVVELWENRDGSETSFDELTGSSNQVYTVDYVMEHAEELVGQEITVEGYVSFLEDSFAYQMVGVVEEKTNVAANEYRNAYVHEVNAQIRSGTVLCVFYDYNETGNFRNNWSNRVAEDVLCKYVTITGTILGREELGYYLRDRTTQFQETGEIGAYPQKLYFRANDYPCT